MSIFAPRLEWKYFILKSTRASISSPNLSLLSFLGYEQFTSKAIQRSHTFDFFFFFGSHAKFKCNSENYLKIKTKDCYSQSSNNFQSNHFRPITQLFLKMEIWVGEKWNIIPSWKSSEVNLYPPDCHWL